MQRLGGNATVSKFRVACRNIIRFVAALCLIVGFAASAAVGEETDGKRYLIIHTDDAGMSHSVNRGTIDGMENGIVSSASIMVPCPWLPEFAAYARQNPDKDYGIHLTVNSEFKGYRWRSVSPPDKVPSLLDDDGYLYHGAEEVVANARADEVEIELRAQIERAKEMGIPLSHLDTHMGTLLMRADLFEIYVRLGVEYNLPILFMGNVAPEHLRQYPGLKDNLKAKEKLLRAHDLPVLDFVTMYYESGPHEARKAHYLKVLRGLKPGLSEIIIHCGFDGPELAAITSSHELRDSDRRIFQDPEVIDEVKKLGIEVITWRQAHEMANTAQPVGE